MRNKILGLRKEGKSYREIATIVGCARSLVAYYCSRDCKPKALKRNNKSRIARTRRLKQQFGGKCSRCDYSKCLGALDFHHLNPEEKEGQIGDLLRTGSYDRAVAEAQKCVLICSNCHREIHEEENAAVV